MNFVKRILENEFTNRIFRSIKTESGLANTFVKEAYELINIDFENEITNADVKRAMKNLTIREKASKKSVYTYPHLHTQFNLISTLHSALCTLSNIVLKKKKFYRLDFF